VALLLLGVAACGDGGGGDAAAACSTAPVPAGRDAAGIAARHDAYVSAAALAASAAAEDERWQGLADGYATLAGTAARVLATGDGGSALSDEEMTRMLTQVVAASAAVDRACRVAELG